MRYLSKDYEEIIGLLQVLTSKVFHQIEDELAEKGNSGLYFKLCEVEMNLLCSIRHLNNIALISDSDSGKMIDNLG